MKKISVIIPCYNVEQFIMRCADSLLAQTIGIEALELIFVNDASTDETYKKLLEIEQKCPDSVLVINQEVNTRQGGARNTALAYASGSYISYVDADDWVEPDMYEKLYGTAVLHNCDMVGSRIIREDVSLDGVSISYLMDNYMSTDCLIEVGDEADKRMDLMLQGKSGGICSKLFRRQMLLEHDLFFPEKILFEDNYWLPMVCLYINRYYVLNQGFYHYVNNPHSTVNNKELSVLKQRLDLELLKLQGYIQRGFFQPYFLGIEAMFCRSYYIDTMTSAMQLRGGIPMELYEQMRTELCRLFPDAMQNTMLLAQDKEKLATAYQKTSQKSLEKIFRSE